MKGFLTVVGETENITVIERSKFICNIKHIENEQQALDFISEVKKRHAFATHGCYAYIADENANICKFSDAGEPQGTAGLPMLNALKGKGVMKTVAVVTRYFGGIKLGAGGLVRAYGGSVSACADIAQKAYMAPAEFMSIFTDYDNYSGLIKILSNKNIVISNTLFDTKIQIDIVVKSEDDKVVEDFNKKLLDYFKGNPKIQFIKRDYFSFPL